MNDRQDDAGEAAGEALLAFAEGPGAAAARALEAAFAEAGQSIEASLARAAERGRLDFSDMAEAIARDLARIAASGLIGTGGAAISQTLNISMGTPAGEGGRALLANRGALEAMMVRMARLGGRV